MDLGHFTVVNKIFMCNVKLTQTLSYVKWKWHLYKNRMTVLPVFSYYLIRWWLRKLQLISPTTCHFPAVHTHKLPSSTCYSFHYPPPLPIIPPVQCLQPRVIWRQLYNYHAVVPFILVFPECPGVAALLSLASVVTMQRQSVFTVQHPILLPVLLNTSECSVEICALCQYCIATISGPTSSPNFLLHSYVLICQHI